MKLLITGSTGFIGRTVIGAAPKGVEVIACTRSGPVPAPAIAVPIGDITGPVEWTSVLQGIDAVVHLAARVHIMHETAGDGLAEFRRVNLDATRGLAEAAAASGVKRFVFLSSVKVHGEVTGDAPLRPDSPRVPADSYSVSKAEAEDALGEIAARSGMDVVIIRPPLTYGAGVGANFLALLRLVDRSVPLPLGRIRNRRSMIYVGNLADVILVAAQGSTRGVETVLVSDGEPVSTPDLIRTLAAALGRRPLLIPVPVTALRLAAASIGRGADYTRLANSLEIDDTAARERLGWLPPVSFRDGITATVDWYRQMPRT